MPPENKREIENYLHVKDCRFALDLSHATLTASEDRAFGFDVCRSVVSFISELIVELEEAELLGVFGIDKLRHLLEVIVVQA